MEQRAVSLSSTTNSNETIAGFVSEEHPAFFLQFWPLDPPRAHVVYLPPFGEEMNRCRSLVAAQARQFARDGLSCSVLDFFGTGESQGELCDASLPIWRQNIDDLLVQLMQRHECPVYLWGCRLGALLALDYLSIKPGASNKLLLWQPVPSGSSFVTQLLRQRSASLMQKGEKTDSADEMKRQLAAGETFEVAGYRLGGELMSAINQLEVASMLQGSGLDNDSKVFWFEHTAEDGGQPAAKSRRIIGDIQEAGAGIEVITFTGDPVWQLNKRAACDDLLHKTRELRL